MATFGQLLQLRKMEKLSSENKKMKKKISSKRRRTGLTTTLKNLSRQHPSAASLVHELMMMFPTDPNPSLPVVEKTVCIRVCESKHYGTEMDWYKVKLSSNDIPPPPPPFTASIERPIWENMQTPLWSCCVPLGPTIYSVGGRNVDYEYSEEVRAIDLSSSTMQFRQVAPMNARRSCPYAVAAEGKIYVLGGNGEDQTVEVFDASNNTWETLPPPPHRLYLQHPLAIFAIYDGAKRRIILGSNCSITTTVLLAYDVTAKSGGLWQVLDSNFSHFEFGWINTSVALFENTLYWIGSHRRACPKEFELVVYDMDLRLWGSTTILGLKDAFLVEQLYHMRPFFHFRGNEFYLIWHDVELKHSLVRCSRILVSKRVDQQEQKIHAEAQVVFTKTYVLPRKFDLIDFVVV